MRPRPRHLLSILAGMIVLGGGSLPASGEPPHLEDRTRLITTRPDGSPQTDLCTSLESYDQVVCSRPAVSEGGRFIAFYSEDPGLVASDKNNGVDVFVRDIVSNETTLVSVNAQGVQQSTSPFPYLKLLEPAAPAISADGRFVAFLSKAKNMEPGHLEFEDRPSLYLHDRQTGQTTWVDQVDPQESHASLSDDGRYLAYTEPATDTTQFAVHVFDSRLQTTTVGPDGWDPSISGDGLHVAFTGLAPAWDWRPLGPEMPFIKGGLWVYAWDVATGEVDEVSVPTDTADSPPDAGVPWSRKCDSPDISDDGRFVAFACFSNDLVPGDIGYLKLKEIFVRDRQMNRTERVNISSVGEGAQWLSNDELSISGDGRFVGFHSAGGNLAEGDVNGGLGDVFVHDRLLGTTELASLLATEATPGIVSVNPALSTDGRYLAYQSGVGFPKVEQLFLRDTGPPNGIGDAVVSQTGDNTIGLSGWAEFTGSRIATVSDPDFDGRFDARQAGGEMLGSDIAYRADRGDLLFRWNLARLPVAMSSANCDTALPGTEYSCTKTVGREDVSYLVRFASGGREYRVVAQGPFVGASEWNRQNPADGSPLSVSVKPTFALLECDAVCTPVQQLQGGYGTAGEEVRVSVPLGAIGASPGGELDGVFAETTRVHRLAEPGYGYTTGTNLDVLDIGDVQIPAPSLSVAAVLAGTTPAPIDYREDVLVRNGSSFTGTLEVAGPGIYDIWIRGCLGTECDALSRRVEVT